MVEHVIHHTFMEIFEYVIINYKSRNIEENVYNTNMNIIRNK